MLNVPPLIATLVTARVATLHELQTVYGMLDAYNLVEIVAVDNHNRGLQHANNH